MLKSGERRVNLVVGLVQVLPEDVSIGRFTEVLGLLSDPDPEVEALQWRVFDKRIKNLPGQISFDFG